MNPEVFVVGAKRSAIGRFGGAFKELTPPALAAPVMRATLEDAGVGGDQLDLVIMGNVLRGGHGQLVPRQAAFVAGIPKHVDRSHGGCACIERRRPDWDRIGWRHRSTRGSRWRIRSARYLPLGRRGV